MKLEDIIDDQGAILIPQLDDASHGAPVVENHPLVACCRRATLADELSSQFSCGGPSTLQNARADGFFNQLSDSVFRDGVLIAESCQQFSCDVLPVEIV